MKKISGIQANKCISPGKLCSYYMESKLGNRYCGYDPGRFQYCGIPEKYRIELTDQEKVIVEIELNLGVGAHRDLLIQSIDEYFNNKKFFKAKQEGHIIDRLIVYVQKVSEETGVGRTFLSLIDKFVKEEGFYPEVGKYRKTIEKRLIEQFEQFIQNSFMPDEYKYRIKKYINLFARKEVIVCDDKLIDDESNKQWIMNSHTMNQYTMNRFAKYIDSIDMYRDLKHNIQYHIKEFMQKDYLIDNVDPCIKEKKELMNQFMEYIDGLKIVKRYKNKFKNHIDRFMQKEGIGMNVKNDECQSCADGKCTEHMTGVFEHDSDGDIDKIIADANDAIENNIAKRTDVNEYEKDDGVEKYFDVLKVYEKEYHRITNEIAVIQKEMRPLKRKKKILVANAKALDVLIFNLKQEGRKEE